MKLLNLAKSYDFETETDYFDYLINSHINGNFTQCKDLFKKLTKDQKKQALNYISGCYDDKTIYNFYFNLL